MSYVLTIGGGGVGGLAWAVGLLHGLGPVLPPGSAWAAVVGTSAGATVGAHVLASTVGRAYDAQSEPGAEIFVDMDWDDYRRRIDSAIAGAANGREARIRLGRLAVESSTVSSAERRVAIASRLTGVDWPEDDRLIITAVDVHTGELVELRRGDGVDLVDAVMASSAVPGMWPVVNLGGRVFMDGGMRSTCNADCGPAGFPRLVVVPSALDERGRRMLTRELGAGPALVVEVGEDALAAIGSNPLDPRCRPAAAEAGLRQAAVERSRIEQFLDRLT